MRRHENDDDHDCRYVGPILMQNKVLTLLGLLTRFLFSQNNFFV